MNSLNDTAAELRDAWQRLGQLWDDVKTAWNDPVRWDFERQYWTPLESQVQATQRELERLAQVIAQAQRVVK